MFINYLMHLLKYPVLWLIRLYQRTISPDAGIFRRFFPYGYCRFHPHCSEYCYQAIDRYGLFIGLIKCLGRVIRCNPWSKGGNDPVK